MNSLQIWYFLILKFFVEKLIDQKETKWNGWKNECIQRMQDLSDAFSGEKPLTRIPKNGTFLHSFPTLLFYVFFLYQRVFFYSENLQDWFKNKSTEIESLNIEKYKSSSRKIIQLLKALEDVQGTKLKIFTSHHFLTSPNFFQVFTNYQIVIKSANIYENLQNIYKKWSIL